ncbi:glutathione S-transferase [Arenicella chitinivorans]|nr:glutathione S-transferase family protein [Arenicella chitinivorans]
MPAPRLYLFTISHYCEKARWGLEYLGIDYDAVVVLPGEHIAIAKQHGLKRGALPYLVTDDDIIQGSDRILRWAEARSAPGVSLNCNDTEAMEMEQRLDHKIGVHVRRHYYSEALVEHSSSVRHVFMRGVGFSDRIKLWLAWSVIRNKMISGLDLGPEQGVESSNIVAEQLDWLDSLLADGRRFLLGGDQMSVVDLSAASLLAPYVLPPQHPISDTLSLPPRLAEQVAAWRSRPIMQHVLSMYKQFR